MEGTFTLQNIPHRGLPTHKNLITQLNIFYVFEFLLVNRNSVQYDVKQITISVFLPFNFALLLITFITHYFYHLSAMIASVDAMSQEEKVAFMYKCLKESFIGSKNQNVKFY